MHVAFVHPDPLGGTALARRLRRTAELLSDAGHEVRVLCTRWWDGEGATFEVDGVGYHAVSDSRRWFAMRLSGAIADYRPDVVHAAGSDPGAALAARLSGRPLVVDWCGKGSPRLLDRALGAGHVCVPSEHVRTKVRERGADATVIPGFVDVERIRAVDAHEGSSPGIVWAGRLDDDAHLGSLLLALAELRGLNHRASVIGEGPRREEYERQARELAIDDRVAFVGELPREERIVRLKGAHVFVHTADRCPFASELLLALACGSVGVVEYCTDSAAHELIAGYDRGIGATDDAGLVDALRTAMELPHRTDDARFERFSGTAVLESYLDLYREVGTA